MIVGTGGYASGPLLYAGALKGIPTLIQEQNSYPGITNKFLAKKAQSICVAHSGMERFFPKKSYYFMENPVRQDILEIHHKKEQAINYFQLDEKKTILVIGGSLGARTINESIAGSLSLFSEKNIHLIWQTGARFVAEAKNRAKENNNVKVKPFITKMDLAYSVADIIVLQEQGQVQFLNCVWSASQ